MPINLRRNVLGNSTDFARRLRRSAANVMTKTLMRRSSWPQSFRHWLVATPTRANAIAALGVRVAYASGEVPGEVSPRPSR